MEPSMNRKTFSQFLTAFLTCRLSFEHFSKKITFIANVF